MRRMSRGFTIIELLVVVSVIGILSTISFTGFNRYQADTRDSQRQSQATIIVEALEKYYDANGEYPGCPAITAAATSITTTLPGIDPKVLVTPQDPTVEDNSIKCQDMTSITGPDVFAYVGDGSTVCSTGASCLGFTLKYKQESTGTIASVNSRRQATLASSGDITDLSATTFSFNQVNLTWTAISGATSYNVQYATNAAFTGATTFTPAPTTNSVSVTGLTLGTTYYFRVQPATTSTTGNWSNTSSATTYTLNTPTGTAIADPSLPASKLDFSWNTVANATSYNVQYSTSSSMTSPTSIIGATNPTTVSGLSAGTTLYFQVKAVAAGYTSGWSTVASATTQVPTPTCTASTLNSNNQVTVNWNAVGIATSYTLQYSTDSGFSGATNVTGLTSTSRAVPGLNNGTTYYFQVEALVGATTSTWGACPSATTGVDGPTGYGWSADGYAVRNAANGTWIAYPGAGTWHSEGMTIYGSCSPGATVVTRLYAYYATASNGSPTGGALMDWTWNNQDRFFEGATSGYRVWWQGWVSCQVGSNRQGDVYLGNAGPYT
jgi:prepilin-type N-terminal cleavage/methylation domain-containing protein